MGGSSSKDKHTEEEDSSDFVDIEQENGSDEVIQALYFRFNKLTVDLEKTGESRMDNQETQDRERRKKKKKLSPVHAQNKNKQANKRKTES